MILLYFIPLRWVSIQKLPVRVGPLAGGALLPFASGGLLFPPSYRGLQLDKKACSDRRAESQKIKPLEICLLVRPLAGAVSEIPEKFHFSMEFIHLLQDGKFQNGRSKNLEFLTNLSI